VGLADAAARRASAHCMHKKCRACGAYSPLSAIGCEECGIRFPVPNDKVDLSLEDLLKDSDSGSSENGSEM
jgi:ribosomal protein L40E